MCSSDLLVAYATADKEALLADLDALEHSRALDRYRGNFLAFCHHVYPEFKEGPHHRNMAKHLAEVIFGDRNRLTVSMPPRFGKSITIAYLFVAWYLGHNPSHHIMMVTHTADLSADFGRQVRNLLSSPVYREIFPNTVVSADKSAANNWATTAGGKYLAIGIGANVAGHGAHLLVADDLEQRAVVGLQRYGTKLQPHNGRDALRDLYEELLDAMAYTRQAQIEATDADADGSVIADLRGLASGTKYMAAIVRALIAHSTGTPS